jgi:hypothetical protein
MGHLLLLQPQASMAYKHRQITGSSDYRRAQITGGNKSQASTDGMGHFMILVRPVF